MAAAMKPKTTEISVKHPQIEPDTSRLSDIVFSSFVLSSGWRDNESNYAVSLILKNQLPLVIRLRGNNTVELQPNTVRKWRRYFYESYEK